MLVFVSRRARAIATRRCDQQHATEQLYRRCPADAAEQRGQRAGQGDNDRHADMRHRRTPTSNSQGGKRGTDQVAGKYGFAMARSGREWNEDDPEWQHQPVGSSPARPQIRSCARPGMHPAPEMNQDVQGINDGGPPLIFGWQDFMIPNSQNELGIKFMRLGRRHS
jgi:hypothetical protein